MANKSKINDNNTGLLICNKITQYESRTPLCLRQKVKIKSLNKHETTKRIAILFTL